MGNSNISHSPPEQEALNAELSHEELLIIMKHQRWMLGLAKRMLNDDHLAEDCVQETFITVTQKFGSFEGRSSVTTWLRRILVNNCLMKLRQMKRRGEIDIDEFMPSFDKFGTRINTQLRNSHTPETLLQEHQTTEYVHKTINSLPTDYRLVLMLRDIEGLSTKEVADALECSEGLVKVRLHRARTALKTLLEPVVHGGLER